MGAAEIGKSLSEEGVPSPDEGCDARHRQDLLDDTSVDATRQDVGQVFEEAVGRAVLQPVVDSVAGAAVLPAGLYVRPADRRVGIVHEIVRHGDRGGAARGDSDIDACAGGYLGARRRREGGRWTPERGEAEGGDEDLHPS